MSNTNPCPWCGKSGATERITSYDGRTTRRWHQQCYVAWGQAALEAIQNAVRR